MSRPPQQNVSISFRQEWHGMPLIREGGVLRARWPIPLPPHRNPGFELTVLLAGEVTWRVEDGTTLQLTPGMIAVTQPQVRHSGLFDIIQPCYLLWLVIDPLAPAAERFTPWSSDDLHQMQAELENLGNTVFHADPRFADLCRELERIRVQEQEGPWVHALARTWLVQSVALALESATRHRATVESETIARAKALLIEGMSERIVLPEIARNIGVSPSRFYERFHQEVGQTPTEFLNRVRCAEARRRLTTTDQPITVIALDLGFTSSQYFTKVFRRYTGMTPSAYRAGC